MNILVFLSKTTGFECLKWMLTHYPDESYTIFISDPDKKMIASYLKSKKQIFYDLAKNDPIKITEGKKYDWLINIWGSYIFRTDILSRVKNSVNLHPSYLPYGRGRDPVVWAIRDGVPAGATMHKITENIDAGSIWSQVKIPYEFPETGGGLYCKVEKTCITLFKQTWPKLYKNSLKPKKQSRTKSQTRKRKHLLADRVLSMEDPGVREIISKIMAHDFSENGYTALLKQGKKEFRVALKIDPVKNR